MTRDNEHNPDHIANAARIVSESTTSDAKPKAELEAAWASWSGQIQNADLRTFKFLRAAFEAGYYAGSGP